MAPSNNTWWTSDQHFDHSRIIQYCNRPYHYIEEMNEAMIKNWNDRVKPNDTIYNLGDVSFGGSAEIKKVYERLNGIKHLIIGNHDKREALHPYFESIHNYYELRGFHKFPLILMHFPIHSWNRQHHGSIHLHGHTHGSLDNSHLLRFDMGVDCWNMNPVSWDELQVAIAERKDLIAQIKEVTYKEDI